MNHAPLAPSSAARIVACPGSRKMCELYPEEDTIAAAEGTASHWAAAQILNRQPVAVGQVADNGVTLNEEMIEGAEMYAEHILSRQVANSWQRRVEFTLNADKDMLDNWGTPDYFELSPDHLYLDDYKFGRKYVEVYKNWQLIDYAWLIAKQFDLMRNGDIKVTMTIHQPRNYHRDGPTRVWNTTIRELWSLFGQLRDAFAIARRDDAPVIATDPSICEDCSARHACEAATAAGWNAVGKAYASAPLNMSNAAAGRELQALIRAEKQLKARITGLEAQILGSIKRGQSVPFWKVAHSAGRTVWLKPVEEIVALGDMLGVDVTKPEKSIVTPKQAIAKGLPAELVAAYSHAPNGAAELVADDGREAALIFGND